MRFREKLLYAGGAGPSLKIIVDIQDEDEE
jgi:hypothetical protein